MKRLDLVKYLEENGFSLLREGKKHSIYSNGARTIPVERHRILDRITANQLCKQDWRRSSDIPRDERMAAVFIGNGIVEAVTDIVLLVMAALGKTD